MAADTQTQNTNTSGNPPPATKPPEPRSQNKSGRTVTVACKVHNGMVLQLNEKRVVSIQGRDGSTRQAEQWVPVGKRVPIHGPAKPFGGQPQSQVVGGYALTFGVDADFFEAWMKQFHMHDAVVNKMIWSHEKPSHAAGFSKEHAALRSGMEPMVPDKDPRRPKPLVGGMEIVTAPESAKPVLEQEDA